MRTLHVGLRVKDLERSLAFYARLGYEVIGTVPETAFGRLTMLKLPGDEFVSIELVHDPHAGPVHPGGLNHLVVQVEDIRATVARLADDGLQGVAPSSPDGSEDFWTACFTDPDGYRIELVQWPAGHPDGMTQSDFAEPAAAPTPDAPGRDPREVIEELSRRQRDSDLTVLDELIAVDMVNHAAGPQGREGLRAILRTIEHDLGPVGLEQHHLICEGDLVTQHLTLHGTHRASTMPLLADAPPSGRPAAWTFIHIWRVVDGVIVEHWACRDDMGLLEQFRTS